MSITASLAMRLKALTAGRAADQPLLLLNAEGERWSGGASFAVHRGCQGCTPAGRSHDLVCDTQRSPEHCWLACPFAWSRRRSTPASR
jgi:hypothetical protein